MGGRGALRRKKEGSENMKRWCGEEERCLQSRGERNLKID